MRRTDFNGPIEPLEEIQIGATLSRRSPTLETRRCFRWDDERRLAGASSGVPTVYFPFDGNYAESTSGGRVWTAAGIVDLVAAGQDGEARLGGSDPLAAAAGSLSLANEGIFNLSEGSSFTIRLWFTYYARGMSAFVTSGTRAIYKGNPAAFGYHENNPPYPVSGWSMELLQTSVSQRVGFLIATDGSGTSGLRVTNTVFGSAGSMVRVHLVFAYDAASRVLQSYLDSVAGTPASASALGFIPNSERLYLTGESESTGSIFPADSQVYFDELGWWDYAWDSEQVACDYANGYSWP